MNCYLWELEAILKGLALRRVDEEERLAVLLFNNRYVANAKKPRFKKVFDREKKIRKINETFKREEDIVVKNEKANRVRRVMNYFKNKNWG